LSEQSDPDISLPFPIEFVIRDTPRSLQASNKKKELWKLTVGEIARAHVETLRDFFFLDDRPLAATIFYFLQQKCRGMWTT
jgi:crossover junction endodeoxyribonuclease RusA